MTNQNDTQDEARPTLIEKLEELESRDPGCRPYAGQCSWDAVYAKGFRAGQASKEPEIDDLSTKLKRTVDAAYHALLEMSAWMGIPERKREKQIEESMSNVRFCDQHDLRENDRFNMNLELIALRAENERLKAEHEKFCIGAQQKTDADFKVTREAAERAREQLSAEREKSKKLVEAIIRVTTDEKLLSLSGDAMNLAVNLILNKALAAHAESETK